MSRKLRWLVVLLVLAALPFTGQAHRLDEYLQATIVAIDPTEIRLQMNLTPGVEVADQVLARIDRDHDGVISTKEANAYSRSLARDMTLRLDHHKLPLKITRVNFPQLTELRTGWGIIQIELCATVRPLAAGPHRLTLQNRHLPGISVFLFNAAQPKSASVRITAQKRNENQSSGEIEFTVD